ncbi:MAG: SPOR domain-containing protein [Gammaproteobacteria bacterium]|nr:SPOR domain-containing protein [Gammaproteobacteria bacterium]
MHRARNTLLTRLAALALSASATAPYAQERFVEDIQVSRTDGRAQIIVDLACPMRFLADTQAQTGVIVEIRVAPFDSCRQLGLGSGIASEAYRPLGGQLANLTEVEYESLGLGDNFLFFRFDQPVSYRISQRGDLRQIILELNPDESPVFMETVNPSVAQQTPAESGLAESTSTRRPLAARSRAPQNAADYILNLTSTREPVSSTVIESITVPDGSRLYVSEASLNGQTWYRLRLGFFGSEEDAEATLGTLRTAFPRAWIGRADPEEVRFASSAEFETGSSIAEAQRAAAVPSRAATQRGAGPAELDPDLVLQRMTEARELLLDQDFDAAARAYTAMLAEPGPHQQEAREYLGVARERLGHLDLAVAEYRAYLQEYPNDPATTRVQRRLEGLLTAANEPREPLRPRQASDEPAWDFVTGLSQYYRRDVDSFDDNRGDFIGLSALQSNFDLSARRTGGRFDMIGRVSFSHFYDLIGEEDNGPGDQTRVSYGYFDVIDAHRDWSMRLGRQSLHNFGVLGRFDGAHVAYGWQPDRRVHATAGHPVDSTRDGVESDRQFIGVAAEFDKLVADANVSVFFNDQTIEGIDARRAIGTQIHYAGENGNITGVIDYDVDYSEINSILALGAWRLPSRTTVNGLIDIRLSPILTTRNALIGQPVTTIEELLIVWTEEEIRQLALDRTAKTKTMTLGVSQTIGERLQLNADLTTTEIEGTTGSGGVNAIPDTGRQTYLTTSLVGTGLFSQGDVSMLNVRYGEGNGFKTSYLTWDARFPVGRKLRINPRLRLAVRDGLLDGTTRETVTLALRLLFNTREHYRFELEIGADSSSRGLADGSTSDSSGYYLNLGYRASY